jgi:hypothetical protein
MQKGEEIQVFYDLLRDVRGTAVVVMRSPAEYRMILKIVMLFNWNDGIFDDPIGFA